MPNIVSNEALCEKLILNIHLSTLSHAYIIEGKSGSGKFTIARNIAAALACKNKNDLSLPIPCTKCSSCLKVLSDKSPDVIIVERNKDKSSISVDQIRNMRTDTAVFPNELDYKLYIIKEADTMTVEAQNALLLTLEEPPSYIIIILLCESSQQLLETIKSRAPTLRTLPVSTDDIDNYLIGGCGGNIKVANAARKLKTNSKDEYQEMLFISDGCIGTAITLLDAKKREPLLRERQLVKKLIDYLKSTQSSTEVYEIFNELPQKRPELSSFFLMLQIAIRDLLLYKKSDYVQLCYFSSPEDALTTSERFTEKNLLQIYNACEDALSAMRNNANIKLTVTELFIKTGLY